LEGCMPLAQEACLGGMHASSPGGMIGGMHAPSPGGTSWMDACP